MKEKSTHEMLSRGTPDFQIELYNVTEEHPRYNMQYHWHNKYEIIYVLSGILNLKLNEKDFTIKKDESIFIPCGIVHGGMPVDCKYICIVFSPSIIHSCQKSRQIMKTQLNYPTVFNKNLLMKGIIKDMTKKETGYELSVIGKLNLLIYNLIKSNNENKMPLNVDFEKIKPAMSYIQENYYKEITLKDVAKAASMSVNYFCKFFKSTTGETSVSYITRYRIEMACEFLLSGMSVTDTAYACGFNDTSYFINIFKKQIGITPKKYKILKKESGNN